MQPATHIWGVKGATFGCHDEVWLAVDNQHSHEPELAPFVASWVVWICGHCGFDSVAHVELEPLPETPKNTHVGYGLDLLA